MPVVVVEPPETVVTADEARVARIFTDDDDDVYVDLLLSIAQGEIDGPDGWLGRSVGEQLLQIEMPAECTADINRLPLPPVIEIVSDALSADGLTRTVQYRAGYESVPPRIKHGIILMAGALRDATPERSTALKKQIVEGVGTFDYGVPDSAADAMRVAAENLLAGFRIARI